MFFNSIKEINRLRKEVNRLLSNVKYLLKSYYWEKMTFSKLRFFKFKRFVSRLVFWELQLKQISLNFKTSCCNFVLQLCVTFLLFWFWKELWRLKSKSPCILSNKNIKFNKTDTESKMKNFTHSFREMKLVIQFM